MAFPQKNIVAYKLLDDNSIFKIPYEDLNSFFININIISVYFYKEKRLYIWKGEDVPRNLQNHIPLIEEQILRLNPDITILRHFTVEGVKEETSEFLELLKINQEDFKKQLDEWDDFRERMLSSIEILQNEIKEHYTNAEFREIQIKANNIIDIAEKIQDNDIISEQEKNILQVIEKLDAVAEEEIKSKMVPFKQKFEDFEKNNQFEEAGKILKEIGKIIENSQDRRLKRYWINAKIKLEQKVEEFEVHQKIIKKEENQREYEKLVEKIKGNELNREWHEGYENCQEIIALLKELEKFDEIKEYNHKSYFFEKAHENERDKVTIPPNIEQKPDVEEETVDLDQKEEEQPMEEEELPLKDEEEQPLKEEESSLKGEEKIIENESVFKENFVDELESEDYNLLLRQANLIESQAPNETKQILKKCLAIITKDRENFIKKNPKRLKDEGILEKRV